MKAERHVMQPGDCYEFAYPFVRDVYAYMDEEGSSSSPCWKPGTRHTNERREGVLVADGIGSQIVTVVSRHTPGKGWPERVFFTRCWRDPEGKQFGKRALHVTTAGAFTCLLRGYRHSFVRADESFIVGKAGGV